MHGVIKEQAGQWRQNSVVHCELGKVSRDTNAVKAWQVVGDTMLYMML